MCKHVTNRYPERGNIMAAHQTRKSGNAAKAQTIARRQIRANKRGKTTNRTGRKIR